MLSSGRPRLRPLYIPQRKHAEFEQPPNLKSKGGHLSPDLQPSTPPTFPDHESQKVSSIGNYLLLEQLDTNGHIPVFKAVHCETQEHFVCKVIPVDKYRDTLSAYWRVNSHSHVNQVEEILLGDTKAYVFFARHYGDLHSYVRTKRKLREPEASRLFRQIVSAVAECHENGVVLRDLKLRKFVFKNEEKTQLKLEGLEDACVLDDEDNDSLADKHGCPAYVSPEILNTSHSYSGKAADIWSLGVMLYTMLIGRYPFHDTEPGALFSKIRRGQFNIPDSVSSRAKCLIRNLLRHNPIERLSADEVVQHPWFTAGFPLPKHSKSEAKDRDQTVPNVVIHEEEDFFV